MTDTRTPVLLLHAFPLDASMWDGIRGALKERRVLSPDFPGFGGRAPAGSTLDALAEAACQALDEANVDRTLVVGLSMGGYVAFRMYDCWPERVTGLVLADTRAGADAEEARAKRTAQADRARREGTGWLAGELIPNLLGETSRARRPEVEARVRETIGKADPEGVARALTAMRDRPDFTPLLSSVRVPVLAIAGEEDTLTPVEEARLIAESVPQGTLLTIPGAGHLSAMEDPQMFADAIADFPG